MSANRMGIWVNPLTDTKWSIYTVPMSVKDKPREFEVLTNNLISFFFRYAEGVEDSHFLEDLIMTLGVRFINWRGRFDGEIINSRNVAGRSPLRLAVLRQNYSAITQILKWGADPTEVINGKSLLAFACVNGDSEMILRLFPWMPFMVLPPINCYSTAPVSSLRFDIEANFKFLMSRKDKNAFWALLSQFCAPPSMKKYFENVFDLCSWALGLGVLDLLDELLEAHHPLSSDSWAKIKPRAANWIAYAKRKKLYFLQKTIEQFQHHEERAAELFKGVIAEAGGASPSPKSGLSPPAPTPPPSMVIRAPAGPPPPIYAHVVLVNPNTSARLLSDEDGVHVAHLDTPIPQKASADDGVTPP